MYAKSSFSESGDDDCRNVAVRLQTSNKRLMLASRSDGGLIAVIPQSFDVSESIITLLTCVFVRMAQMRPFDVAYIHCQLSAVSCLTIEFCVLVIHESVRNHQELKISPVNSVYYSLLLPKVGRYLR